MVWYTFLKATTAVEGSTNDTHAADTSPFAICLDLLIAACAGLGLRRTQQRPRTCKLAKVIFGSRTA